MLPGQPGAAAPKQLAPLVHHAEHMVSLPQVTDHAAQKGRFAAAWYAGYQDAAGQIRQGLHHRHRQLAGDPARHPQVERGDAGKTGRTAHPRHPHTTAARDGEIALAELVLVCVGRMPAQRQKAVLHGLPGQPLAVGGAR